MVCRYQAEACYERRQGDGSYHAGARTADRARGHPRGAPLQLQLDPDGVDADRFSVLQMPDERPEFRSSPVCVRSFAGARQQNA